MTKILFNNKPSTPSFNNFVDDLLANIPSLIQDDLPSAGRHSAPANIRETEQGYIIELFAAGLDKEDISIGLENNTLTIAGTPKADPEKEKARIIRNEFRRQSFKRSFTIDEKTIDAGNIVAKYLNGVLTLNLPKKGEVKEETKQITIQ